MISDKKTFELLLKSRFLKSIPWTLVFGKTMDITKSHVIASLTVTSSSITFHSGFEL